MGEFGNKRHGGGLVREMDEFQQLVDEHYASLYRFAYSLAKSPESASDLVQQTFCIWAEKNEQLQDRTKAKTWLFTTLYREFLSQRRRSSRMSDTPIEELAERVSAQDEVGVERQVDGQEALAMLGTLEETFRAPLTLFYLKRHTYKEIADILEVPIGTVMSRISRAKEIMRKLLLAGPSSVPKNILHFQPEALKTYGS